MFAAGADVEEMAGRNCAGVTAISRGLYAGCRAVAAIGEPVVAAITGVALGGGLGLALCAGFRVAGENVSSGVPEILPGVIPGRGGARRLPGLTGPVRARSLICTGRFAGAGEALRAGLAGTVVPDAEVSGAAARSGGQFVSGPALALRAATEAIGTGPAPGSGAGLEAGRLRFAALLATGDHKPGMGCLVAGGPGRAKFAGTQARCRRPGTRAAGGGATCRTRRTLVRTSGRAGRRRSSA